MPVYKYTARDNKGKVVTGVVDALNDGNAVAILATKGLTVLGLEEKKGGSTKSRKAGKVPTDQLVMFTRMLATMVEAGMPLVQSLTALYEQTDPVKGRNLRAVLADVIGNVEKGNTLTESLARHPQVFDKLYVSMVRVGEEAGALPKVMADLAALRFSRRRPDFA